MTPDWLSDARKVPAEQVLAALGLSLQRRTFDACPACGEAGNGSPKVYTGSDGAPAWRCFRCSAGGDLVTLVSLRLTGRGVDRSTMDVTRDWYSSRGWCQPDERRPAPAPVAPPPPPPKATRPDTSQEYPPASEVEALLGSCRPAAEDEQVLDWLIRRLGPEGARLGRCVWALPQSGRLPRWARFRGRSWADLGYCAIFPMFDASGQLRSVRARAVGDVPEGAPKALPATGYRVAGLVMADKGALSMLLGEAQPRRIVIAEGEPAFLAWRLARPGTHEGVLGLVAGSWSEALAERIPDGARVLSAVDHDEAGDAYHAKISASLSARVRLDRWTPPPLPALPQSPP